MAGLFFFYFIANKQKLKLISLTFILASYWEKAELGKICNFCTLNKAFMPPQSVILLICESPSVCMCNYNSRCTVQSSISEVIIKCVCTFSLSVKRWVAPADAVLIADALLIGAALCRHTHVYMNVKRLPRGINLFILEPDHGNNL